MVTALRIFAGLFFLSAAFFVFIAVNGSAESLIFTVPITLACVLSGVLCAATSTALEKLIEMEKHSKFIAEETLAMHRTIALNTPLKSAAE